MLRSEATVMGNAGRDVSCMLVGEVWDGDCLLEPDMGLTKICIVSVVSGDTDREIGVEERILRGCDEGRGL